MNPSNPDPIKSATDPLGQCVTACRHYAQGLPDHTKWTKGVPVVFSVNGKLIINPAVKPGTAIAAGWDAKGHYPGSEDPHKNSGVFLGPALLGPRVAFEPWISGRVLRDLDRVTYPQLEDTEPGMYRTTPRPIT